MFYIHNSILCVGPLRLLLLSVVIANLSLVSPGGRHCDGSGEPELPGGSGSTLHTLLLGQMLRDDGEPGRRNKPETSLRLRPNQRMQGGD